MSPLRWLAEAGVLFAMLSASTATFVACHPDEPRPTGPTRVYVSNEDSGDVSVIDPSAGTVIATIPVGKRPRGMRLSADGRTLYVALSGSPKAPPGVDESTLPPADRSADGIGVVDAQTFALVKVLPSGQDPETFDLTPDGQRLVVSNEETAEASIVDLRAGRVARAVPVGVEPEGVAVRPDGAVAYVTSETDHDLAVVDLARGETIARVPTGKRPRAVLFTADGRQAFVSDEMSASVTVVDATEHRAVATIDLGDPAARPMGLALSPDGDRLFVANGRARTVSVVDVPARRVVRTIADVAARPWGLAVNGDGSRLYVAGGPSGDVAVVDVERGVVHQRIPAGRSPWGVVAGPAPEAAR